MVNLSPHGLTWHLIYGHINVSASVKEFSQHSHHSPTRLGANLGIETSYGWILKGRNHFNKSENKSLGPQ